MGEPEPCCYDCLSGDVAVKLIDPYGFEHYFCAPCDAGWQEFRKRLAGMLSGAADRLAAASG